MLRNIANILAFNVGWFACVFAAGRGLPWVGPLVVLGLAIAHAGYFRFDRRYIALLALLIPIGYAADGTVMALGALAFPDEARAFYDAHPLMPLWMAALWVNLGLSLHLSMSWLSKRPGLASAFGALGGASSYYAGSRLGAVELGEPLWLSLLIIAVEWAIVMPLLAVGSTWFDPRPGHPAFAETAAGEPAQQKGAAPGRTDAARATEEATR